MKNNWAPGSTTASRPSQDDCRLNDEIIKKKNLLLTGRRAAAASSIMVVRKASEIIALAAGLKVDYSNNFFISLSLKKKSFVGKMKCVRSVNQNSKGFLYSMGVIALNWEWVKTLINATS